MGYWGSRELNYQASRNKAAWEYQAYEFWVQSNGTPDQVARDMLDNPTRWLRRHLPVLGDVNGRRILHPLGSNGRKGIPLAILGAEVTIIDISEENKRYAQDVARAAGVDIEYIAADYGEYEDLSREESYDIAYLEGGVLHYFEDIANMFRKTHRLLKCGGRLILDDFHPFRKLAKDFPTEGDYFDTSLHEGPVAYAGTLEGVDPSTMPQCLLRHWTLGEVVTAIATAGLRIEEMTERARAGDPKVPSDYVILATRE